MNRPSKNNSSPPTSFFSFFLRLFWIAVGNVALVASAIKIGQTTRSLFSNFDIAFWIMVILLILARYLDIVYFHGETSDGAPATLQHWKRYAGLLVLLSLAGWGLAHAAAYFT